MRCLILIALIALASATYSNKHRFNRLIRSYGGYENQNQNDDFETEYRPRQRFGGLHDIMGQYGQEDGECSPMNPEQCQRGEYDEDQEEDQYENGQGWQGRNSQYRNQQQCRKYGQCDQDDQDEEYGQQGRFQDQDEDQEQYGQQCYGGQCEEDESENGQYRQGGQRHQGRNSQYRKYMQCLKYGKCNQYDQNEYGQDQDEEQYGDWDSESEQGEYGNQWEQQSRGGQCRSNPRMLPKLENINCHLATSLYKQARRERDDKNIVVSPTAVLLGLGALNIGAKGHTKKEIGLVSGEQPTVNGLKALLRLLKKGGQGGQGGQWMSYGQEDNEEMMQGGYGREERTGGQHTQIKPFTGIFLSKSTPTQRSFIQKVQTCLGVKVKKCDFQRHPQQCRQQINQWVSQKTQHKMPRLVPQDCITDNTKMLVVSGLQLKAKWGKQFRNHQTTQGVFHPLDCQKPKQVPMMQKRGVFKYHEDDTVKVLGIPTQGNELTMYVILPKCKKCLLDVEKEQLLEGDQLKRLLDNCDQKKQQVDVKLPKFQIKHKIDAKRTLLNKGMVNMCEQKTADFSGITGCRECSQKAKYNLRHPIGQRNRMDENDYQQQGQRTQQGQIHLNKFLTQATIKVTDSGITSAGPQGNQYEGQDDNENEQYSGYSQQYFQDESDDEEQTYMTGRDRFDQIVGGNGGSRRFGQGMYKKTFNAKHPFAFVVRHNPTKQMLLIGRVIDAGQKQPGTQWMGGQMQDIFPSQQYGQGHF